MTTTDRRDMNGSPVPGTGKLPLEGLRILDITVVWAGPYGTMHLADWGAEVIRIESIKHFATSTRGQMARPPLEMVRLRNTGMGYVDDDPGDRPWNRNAIFNTHARNKLSVTMDLNTPEGQEALERLVASADGLHGKQRLRLHGTARHHVGAPIRHQPAPDHGANARIRH